MITRARRDNGNVPLSFTRVRSIFIYLIIVLLISSGTVGINFTGDQTQDTVANVAGSRGNGGEVKVLLINASAESTPIISDLIAGNASYNLTMESENDTDSATWDDYDILVWAQGRRDVGITMDLELQDYVISGGHLLIEGANIAEHATESFEDDAIHASSVDRFPNPDSHYVGQNLTKNGGNHPVAEEPNSLSDPIEYVSSTTSRLDSDVCNAENGSVVAIEWDQFTTVNGTTNENTQSYGGVIAFDDNSNLSDGGQVVFYSFGIALVTNETDRMELVENSMDWLIPIELGEYYAFYMSPDFQEATTNTGGTVIYEILVHNNGTLDDTVDLENSTAPNGWTATLNQSSIDVSAGENGSVSLTVTAPLSAQNGEFANITVNGTSQGDVDLVYIVYTNTTVNNEARSDLEPLDLGPQDGKMVLGEDTTIISPVRNNGDRDANNVVVSFFLDENNYFNLMGNDTIDVPAGEVVDAIILWNATNVFGDHVLIVEVDQGQNHPETDETNNNMSNATTDWTVKGTVQFTDDQYNITGNLSIQGNFLLDNVTILFNSTDGQYGFDSLLFSFLDADLCSFGPLGTEDDSTYWFKIRGEVDLTNSTMYGLDYNGDSQNPKGGVQIYSSTVMIDSCTFRDSAMGIWTSVAPVISNSTFTSLEYYGIFSNGGSPIISLSQFSITNTAISLVGGAGEVSECDVTDVSTGIYVDQSSIPQISGNDIHDLNGLRRGIFITGSSPYITGNQIFDTNTAIWVEGGGSPLVYDNDLSGNDYYSAYSLDSDPVFDNNMISDNGNYGFNLNGGSVTILDSSISNNANKGIMAYRVNLILDDITFSGNSDAAYDEGIFSYDSTIWMYNSTFQSSTFELDINLTRNSVLSSFASDFDEINITGGSMHSHGVFLDLLVSNRYDDPLEGANIFVYDINSELVFTGVTDENGTLNDIQVIIYNETEDGEEWFTEHFIEVDYQGQKGNATENLSEVSEIEIIVNEPPTAVLTVNKETGTSETEFNFDSDGSGDDGIMEEFFFDFGDGENTGWTSRSYATHIYSIAGYFTVSLKVKDDEGAVSAPATVEVFVNNDPIVNLPETMQGKQNVAITFDADVYDPDVWDNLHYLWEFDDGTNSSLIAPEHTFDEMGTYTVVLWVMDDHGGNGTDYVRVDIGRNKAPEAKAGENINVTYNNGASVQFTSYSLDEDGDPLTFHWDFGDGKSSGVENPNHFYNEPGSYNVTLTVEDDSGASNNDTIVVNVIEYLLVFPDEPTMEGKRGQTIRPSIKVKNAGSHTASINLSVEGKWIAIYNYNITLEANESKYVNVVIPINENAPMGITEQTLITEVMGFEFRGSIFVDVIKEFGVVLNKPSTQSGDPGDILVYTVQLTNRGSDIDTFEVLISSSPPGWIITLNTAVISSITSNGKGNIVVNIEIPENEEEGIKTVSLIASSISDPSASAEVDIKVEVNSYVKPDDESSSVTVYAISILLLLLVVVGGFMYTRRESGIRYADDEYEDEYDERGGEGDDSWDDGPVVSKGKKDSKQKSKKPKPMILKCPKCGTLLEVPTTKRPITIQCPGCGARAKIK